MMVADVLALFCQICSAFKASAVLCLRCLMLLIRFCSGVGGLAVVNSKKHIEYLCERFKRKTFM